MLKNDNQDVVSEDDEDSQITNGNGKRPNDTQNKDGKKRLRTKNLFRQPTVNELNRLQETENLFNSNLFRLQIEEVLQEVTIKEKTEKKFQQWFKDFRYHLLSIPEDVIEYDLTEQTLTKKLKVKLPISSKLKQTKCVFKFHKFNDIEIVGSYALGCSINSKLRIDVQISVPTDTYTKNDSINYRYHKKRAAYMAYLASHLKGLESIEELTYTWIDGCETKPVTDIKPTGKLANHFQVRINLTCEQEAYKLHRFSPSRNNLRETWLLSEESSESTQEVGPPTPYYNSSVLSDVTASKNHSLLKDVLLNSENLKQAIVLLKIWLHQRKLQVSGHVISLFVVHLVQIKRINNIMSSYQIVRNVWIALKSSEWDTKGISLYKGSDSPQIEEFHQHFPVVFLDTTGYYNLCWQMTKGTYAALRRESEIAVEMLDNGSINSFIPLFMVPVQPLAQFDHILRFKTLPGIKQAVLDRTDKATRLNYGVEELALATSSLHALLSAGLRRRAALVLPLVDAHFSWPVTKTAEKAKDGHEERLSFGLILNPEHAFNVVEKGPSANLPEAEEFRSFWGDKSELRRFQDGSITETCVWEGDSTSERRTVTKQIIDYLMQLKFDISPTALFHIQSQLSTLTAFKQYSVECEEASAAALQAFDALRSDLRALTALPLDISAVYGVSPVFSYCDPLPPLPRGAPHAPHTHKPWRRGATCLIKDGAIPEYTPVCRAVVELGHSGKWPGDIQAFRCLKAAFHLQIADQLTKQHSLPAQAYATHLDVLKNGLVFRLQIAHPKEITLLKRETENGVVKYRESEESVNLQCDTVLLPRLRGALHGLHQKQPAFGGTACLFKRWLCAHLLSPPHFPSPLADLLAAHVFVRPQPLRPTATPLVGLVRVLHLVAETDWGSEMLVLDFNDDMKREEIAELESKFSARDVTQPPYMHVVTACDGDLPSVWSVSAPTAQVVARVQVLARSTLKFIEDSLLNEMKDNLLRAFVPSLQGFDVLIKLRPELVPHSAERVAAGPASNPLALPEELAEIIPAVEFDPVSRYLDELRSAYSEFALFFHDACGGDVIAVLWRPDVGDVRDLQIANAHALKPIQSNGKTKYKVNLSALIEDFKLLGKDLVEECIVQS